MLYKVEVVAVGTSSDSDSNALDMLFGSTNRDVLQSLPGMAPMADGKGCLHGTL